MREWFYAGFAGRIYMVMICDERASAGGRKEGGGWMEIQRRGGGESGRETVAAVAAIGAARFVYRG